MLFFRCVCEKKLSLDQKHIFEKNHNLELFQGFFTLIKYYRNKIILCVMMAIRSCTFVKFYQLLCDKTIFRYSEDV
jgi:hypothetical protein